MEIFTKGQVEQAVTEARRRFQYIDDEGYTVVDRNVNAALKAMQIVLEHMAIVEENPPPGDDSSVVVGHSGF